MTIVTAATLKKMPTKLEELRVYIYMLLLLSRTRIDYDKLANHE